MADGGRLLREWRRAMLLLALVLMRGSRAQNLGPVGGSGQREQPSSWDLGVREYKQLWKDRISHNTSGSTSPVRQRLLYCRIGIGFHLQVLPDGTVNGVHQSSRYSVLELLSVGMGIVGVRAAGTGLFLALSPRGTLYGSKTFTEDCLFREKMEENYYTTYSSHSHPQLYVALTKRGSARNAHKAWSHHPSTHFILRLVGMS